MSDIFHPGMEKISDNMTKKPQKKHPQKKTPSTPIIEGLRQPKPRKNPCASAAKHQKDRAENDSKTLFSIQNT